MEDIEGFDARGERARLFPVLAESSKEGRTLSIVLATLAQVPEFAASVLNAIGRRHGKWTTVETYTEISFPKFKDQNSKLDCWGLEGERGGVPTLSFELWHLLIYFVH